MSNEGPNGWGPPCIAEFCMPAVPIWKDVMSGSWVARAEDAPLSSLHWNPEERPGVWPGT